MNPAGLERDGMYTAARYDDLLQQASRARQARPDDTSRSQAGRLSEMKRRLGVALVGMGRAVQGSAAERQPALEAARSGGL